MANQPMTAKQSATRQLNDELEQGILRSVDNNALVAFGLDRVGVDQMTTLFDDGLSGAGYRGEDNKGYGRERLRELGHTGGGEFDPDKPTVIYSVNDMANRTPEENRYILAHEFGHAGTNALSDFKPDNIGDSTDEAIMRYQDISRGDPSTAAESLRYVERTYADPKGTMRRAKDYHKQLTDLAQDKLYNEGKRVKTQNTASDLASKGRYGDTMMVHMNPIEVDALAKLSPTGALTTNPDTGQPEAFLPLLGALAGGWLAPSMGIGLTAAMGAGLGSFAGSMAQGDDFGTAMAGGLMSFGMGSMLNAAGGVAADVGSESILGGAMDVTGGGGVLGNVGTSVGSGVIGNTGAGMAGSGVIGSGAPTDILFDASQFANPGVEAAQAATAAPPIQSFGLGPYASNAAPHSQLASMTPGNPGTGPLGAANSMRPMGPTIGAAQYADPVASMGPQRVLNNSLPNLSSQDISRAMAEPTPLYNLEMSQAAGEMPLSPPSMMDQVANTWADTPAAFGPDTITNPAYTKMGFGDKMDYLGDKVGWGQAAKNAITGNPIGTAAFGIGAMGGGLGSLTGAGPQPAIPDFTKKTYAKRPYQKSGNQRSFIAKPAGYRPGIDPERTYLDPIGTYDQSFAAGGIVQPGAGYRPGMGAQHNYGFGITQPRTSGVVSALTPSIPSPAPSLPPMLGGGGEDPTSDPADVNDTANDTHFGPPDGAPGSIGNTDDDISLGDVLGGALQGVLGAATMGSSLALGALTGAVSSAARVPSVPDMVSSMTSPAAPAGPAAGHGPEGWGGYNDGGNDNADGGVGDTGDPTAGHDDGGVDSWAEGGRVTPSELQPETPQQAQQMEQIQQNPIVMGAVAAIAGQHPEPQKAIQQFVQTYGEKAFVQLRQQVIAEQSSVQRGQEGIGGMIQGPGTGTSDSIPAQITQDGQSVEEVRVADGEYIMPKAQVDEYEGNGMMAKLEADRKAIVGKDMSA